MTQPTHTCGVCLIETRMPVRVPDQPTPLRVDGKTVTTACELCAAELGVTAIQSEAGPQ